MKVAELMTRDVKTCGDNDSLNTAAQIMWEHDCGCVPILDAQHKLAGIVTDRDICMSAYTQGMTLAEIPVRRAMSPRVISCSPDDELEMAHQLLRMHEIHRIPVVDPSGAVLGILSLGDIANHLTAARENAAKRAPRAIEIAATISAIRRPRVNGASNGVSAIPAASAPRSKKPVARRKKSSASPE